MEIIAILILVPALAVIILSLLLRALNKWLGIIFSLLIISFTFILFVYHHYASILDQGYGDGDQWGLGIAFIGIISISASLGSLVFLLINWLIKHNKSKQLDAQNSRASV